MRSIQLSFLGVLVAGCLAAFLLALFGPMSIALASDSEDGSENSVAVCSIISLTNELMETDRFRPARDEHQEKLNEELILPFIEEGRALEAELQGADPEDPSARAKQQRLLQLSQQILPRNQQDASIRYEQFIVTQTLDAYALVKASAQAIAEEEGYTYLLASIDPEDDVQPGPMSAVRGDILGRTVLMMPDGVNINDNVRRDLKLN